MKPNYAKQVKATPNKLLGVGFIYERDHSNWIFPIVVVPKQNGKLQICVDYRNLNAQIALDTFPLPFIDAISIK